MISGHSAEIGHYFVYTSDFPDMEAIRACIKEIRRDDPDASIVVCTVGSPEGVQWLDHVEPWDMDLRREDRVRQIWREKRP